MKMPIPSLAGIQEFMLRHGEKFVVAGLGLFALSLIGGGLNALRLKSAQQSQTPQAIKNLTDEAVRHIGATTEPPQEIVHPKGELAKALEPWRPQHLKLPAASSEMVLSRPFTQDIVKRGKPEVFPIEDLRAIAGVTVLPDPAAAAAFGGEGLGAMPEDGRPRRRPRPGSERAGAEGAPPAGPSDMFTPTEQTVPEVPGRVTQYVVVTGLVPVAKQRAEFVRCYSGAGFQDPQRDTPRWGQYAVERSQVVNGTAGKWERLKVAAVAQGMAGEGGGGQFQQGAGPEPLQDDRLPPLFMLGTAESDVPYVAGLPQLLYDSWGAKAVHPWFLPELRKLLKEQQATAVRDPEVITAKRLADEPKTFKNQTVKISGMKFVGEPVVQPTAVLVAQTVTTADGTESFPAADVGVGDKVIFVRTPQLERELAPLGGIVSDKPCDLVVRIEMLGTTPAARILSIQYLDATGAAEDEPILDPNPFPLSPVAMGGEFAGGELGGPSAGSDFRLFRYIDRTVKPGATYAYRVKLVLSNPNFAVEPRFLADPTSAKNEFLVSASSNESRPVVVPQPSLVLVRTIGKEDAKALKLRKEAVEMLVLGPKAGTGNYRFSRVITELGGLVNADPDLNTKADIRVRGDRAETGRTLVDVRGRQVEDDPSKSGPREMVEALVLGPDGTLDVVSYAGSEPLFDRYRNTLPPAAPPDDKRPRTPTAPPRGGGL